MPVLVLTLVCVCRFWHWDCALPRSCLRSRSRREGDVPGSSDECWVHFGGVGGISKERREAMAVLWLGTLKEQSSEDEQLSEAPGAKLAISLRQP